MQRFLLDAIGFQIKAKNPGPTYMSPAELPGAHYEAGQVRRWAVRTGDGRGRGGQARCSPQRGGAGAFRTLIGLILCGISFGYVEAAVVVYLRALYEPMHQQLYPHRAEGDLLPLIPLRDCWGDDRTLTELYRELATLVLIAGVALAAGRNVRQGLAAFVLVFGLWDLGYYAFLRLLIGWPGSLLTWDILFLVPVPWVAPVLAPILVAAVMVVGGAGVFQREELGRLCIPTVGDWWLMIAGGGVIWWSFCWDFRKIEAGGMAGPYPWWLFSAGLAIAVLGFGLAWRRPHDRLIEPIVITDRVLIP